MKKKILFYLMIFILAITTLPFNVLAEVTYEELTATKEAVKTNNVGEYDINITVPGKEQEKVSSYNVLFVIDASTSMRKDKWTNTRKALLEMVDILLPENSNSNVNKVGLISFGIDSHVNIPLTNDRDKFTAIPEDYNEASDKLLAPGRSATNTEAALSGATNYLEGLSQSQRKDVEHTYVVFLTDGEANYSEAKYNFYKLSVTPNSNGTYPSYRGIVIMEYVRLIYQELVFAVATDETITAPEFVYNSINEIKELYKSLNPESEETDFATILKEVEKTDEFLKIIDNGIVNYYAYKGIDVNQSYSINEMERAYFTKKTTNNAQIEGMLEEGWYVQMITPHPTTDKIEVERTIAAGKKLAKHATVFTIGFGSVNSWQSKMILNPEYYTQETNEEHYSSYFSKASTTNIVQVFEKLTEEIVKISYKNINVVDYTSKWVQPKDINNDGIFDEKDIIVTNNGEKVANPGVTVKKLTSEEISALNDPELNNNEVGDIYEITWDMVEYLRSWDKFKLTYKVLVDNQEPAFVSNTEYKANGITTLRYDVISKSSLVDEETIIEEDVKYDIKVPTVKQIENIIIIEKQDEKNKPLEGTDFDIKEEIGTQHVKKEYSTDGESWTTTNEDNKATYFKYSGLYNYNYTFEETLIPEGYVKAKDVKIELNEAEGLIKLIEVKNITIEMYEQELNKGDVLTPPHTDSTETMNFNLISIPLYLERKKYYFKRRAI